MKDKDVNQTLDTTKGEETLPGSQSKKIKKNKKNTKNKELTKDEQRRLEMVEEAAANQEFREYNRVAKKLKKATVAWFVLLIAVFVFISGSYLIFKGSEIKWWEVWNTDHEHQFDKSSPDFYYDGDCQHEAYNIYKCTYPYCDEKVIEYGLKGNHKYHNAPDSMRTIDNEEYEVYICTICGEENLHKVGG